MLIYIGLSIILTNGYSMRKCHTFIIKDAKKKYQK